MLRRTAPCAVVDPYAHCRSRPGRRPVAARRCPAVCATLRHLGGGAGQRNQFGDRLIEHAVPRHRPGGRRKTTDCLARVLIARSRCSISVTAASPIRPAQITAAAGGRKVSSRWRSMIRRACCPVVIGVSPVTSSGGALRADRRRRPILAGLRDGDIALSQIAASRLGARTGDSVQLPTVTGLGDLRVAGVFRPTMIDDAAVGTSSWRPTRWRAPTGRPSGIRSRSPIPPLPKPPPTVTISAALGRA